MAIEILTVNESLVVDSRLIADELGIKHKNLRETIDRYLTELQEFGTITFETSSSKMPDGRINPKPERYCFLNEDQAIFLITLSRNTLQVVRCKKNLVKAFSEAKKFIKEEENARLKGENEKLKKSLASYQQRDMMLEYQQKSIEEMKAERAQDIARFNAIEAEREKLRKWKGGRFYNPTVIDLN